jgi:signal transduction histidine kinase
MTTPTRATQSDEVRDLQLVLLAGLLSPFILGPLILLTGPTGVITIPTLEPAIAAVVAFVVAVTGWLLLRTGMPVRNIAWLVLITYTFVITAAVHYTGGPQTPMPALYVLVVVAASFVLGRRATNFIAFLSLTCYALLLFLEYFRVITPPEIWRIPFDPSEKGFLLVVNWMAVATPTILTAFLCGTLAGRLKTRNQQLHESERLRTQMIEMLVHDLRNPLTALLGGLDIINLVLGKQMNDDQRHLLDNARRSGHTLLAMIGDMLDVTKMEAGQFLLKRQPLSPEIMLAETIEGFYALAEMESLTLDLEPVMPMPPIYGDKQLLMRVLANLTTNAIKHTPPGGKIVLSARRHYERYAALSVRDTGEGIPPDQQQRIFDKFAQVEKGSLVHRGTGLGLTFCKMAIESHGGRIWVETAPDQGSIFVFTVPLLDTTESALPPTQPAESVPAGR